MLQLDGGRFASSDLNDLTAVINRNNWGLACLLFELNAPVKGATKNEPRPLCLVVTVVYLNC